MNSKIPGNRGLQRKGWLVGIVVALLLIGVGLELFAQQELGQASVATMLLALYLAALLYVVGLVGLVVLTVSWLVGWQRGQETRAAASRYSPAPQSLLQQGVAPVVPSQLSRDSHLIYNEVVSPLSFAQHKRSQHASDTWIRS